VRWAQRALCGCGRAHGLRNPTVANNPLKHAISDVEQSTVNSIRMASQTNDSGFQSHDTLFSHMATVLFSTSFAFISIIFRGE